MKSVNTVFAQLAVKMGAPALVKQADQFGFDTKVPYELPVKTSLMPDPAEMTAWETAWAGVGQPVGEHESPAGPQSTVLQMALVAAGHRQRRRGHGALRGRQRARPRGPGARGPPTPSSSRPPPTRPPPSRSRTIMEKVVSSGSGAGRRSRASTVAGKTGTAEVGKGQPTNAWFIAFAPAENPTVAVAIMIEGGGVGGRVAAPAAKPVLEAALKAQRGK